MITTAFVENSFMYAPGERELDYKTAVRFRDEGKGNFVDKSDAPDDEVEETEETEDTGTEGATEIPEDFPKREVLIENGYDTMEKIRNATSEDLLEIEGIGEATLNTIGNAVSEFDGK